MSVSPSFTIVAGSKLLQQPRIGCQPSTTNDADGVSAVCWQKESDEYILVWQLFFCAKLLAEGEGEKAPAPSLLISAATATPATVPALAAIPRATAAI